MQLGNCLDTHSVPTRIEITNALVIDVNSCFPAMDRLVLVPSSLLIAKSVTKQAVRVELRYTVTKTWEAVRARKASPPLRSG